MTRLNKASVTGIDLKKIEWTIAFTTSELGFRKPALRKLIPAVSHILAAEHAEPKHVRGCQLRLKFWIKIPPFRRMRKMDGPIDSGVVASNIALGRAS